MSTKHSNQVRNLVTSSPEDLSIAILDSIAKEALNALAAVMLAPS